MGRAAALLVFAQFSGQWSIAFQAYNPGVQRFWTSVAVEVAVNGYQLHEGEPTTERPPDTWLTFTT